MPLAFAFLGLAALLLISGVKGGTVADAAAGKLNKPLDPSGPSFDPATFMSTDPTKNPGKQTSAPDGSPVSAGTSVSGLHLTLGLPGYPAHDYFAPSGSPAVAPVDGVVTKLSGHDPAQGPSMGPHGPLGWSVYIKGDNGHSYFLTHMGSRSVHVGQRVKQGQQIGTVADYARYGTPSHIHMGVR